MTYPLPGRDEHWGTYLGRGWGTGLMRTNTRITGVWVRVNGIGFWLAPWWWKG